MNEPKQYEVRRYDGLGFNAYGETLDPVAYCALAEDYSFTFKQLPDGPLWRVEVEKVLRVGEVRLSGYRIRNKTSLLHQDGVAKKVGKVILDVDAHKDWEYYVPAHLVLISAEPEAQLSSQTIESEVKTCATTPMSIAQPPTNVRVETKNVPSTEKQSDAVASNAPLDVRPVEPVPQQETEWRELGVGDVKVKGYQFRARDGEAVERFEPIRHMLPGGPPIPSLFGSTTDYPSFTNGESLSQPMPPSAHS